MEYVKNFDEFNINENESKPLVKKGQKVQVQFNFFEGKPVVEIEARGDSEFNEYLQAESFTFLHGGDMMMFAKWDGQKWISE